MKIKLNNYIGAAAVLLLSLQACKKDFLDKQPITQVTPDIAFSDAEAAEKLMQGVYDGMYVDYFIWDYMTNGDVTSDNAYAGGDNSANIQIDEFKTNATNGNLGRDWSGLYTTIKNANLVLDNVPNIEDPALDEGNRRSQILAEARAIRAYSYFHLVRLCGPVPLVGNVPANINEMQPARASVDEVYAQIIEDLDFAAANARTSAPNKGIITQGVAHAILAQVYAALPTPNWTKVLEEANATIASGYSLFGSYDGLFEMANENNSESIWEMQYDGYGGAHGNWMPSVIVGSGWKRFNTPSNDLVKAFDNEGDEIRKNSSIKFLDSSTEAWSDAFWTKDHYPYINKYRSDDQANAYFIRLAEIILLKAEALNELSAGGWAEAKPLVDQIRGRVNLLGTTAASQSAMRDAILKERRLELAFEGYRWFDLLRTNKAVETMNAVTDGAGKKLYTISQADLLWPIPQAEVDRNPNL